MFRGLFTLSQFIETMLQLYITFLVGCSILFPFETHFETQMKSMFTLQKHYFSVNSLLHWATSASHLKETTPLHTFLLFSPRFCWVLTRPTSITTVVSTTNIFVTVDLRTSYCYCGGNYGSATWTSEASCMHNCAGDTSQKCGYGSDRYSVFEVGSEDCELRGKLR